jgi:hypothetical protein
MLREERTPDPGFNPDEDLYRRVPLTHWDDKSDPLETDAIELPDMSVVRSKYAHPEWTRFDEHGNYAFEEWGIIAFRVGDVPPVLLHLGRFRWTFDVLHTPLKRVYPHSEVYAYEDGVHVSAKEKLDPNLHLRWRELLLRSIRKILGPYESIEVRQDPP